ncbi:MAG: NADP-dependent malic enzyme [Patescibacteria group bacterium UBA2103]
MKNIAEKALKAHKKLKGKIKVDSKVPLTKQSDFSLYYTPGVAAVCTLLAKNKKEAKTYTIKNNTVAVISDGSAVLGLGNIGPYGALPVMEGKALIFKELAGVDAFPIVLDTQDPDEIVETIKNIAPAFGGINLEDIKAPQCFEIERRVNDLLDIPVMHDDQHGTAIVVLAGLINAAKVVGKKFEDLNVVIVGAGAAGTAIANLLVYRGVGDVIVLDSIGAIYKGRDGLYKHKEELAQITNKDKKSGSLSEVVEGADVIIGVAGKGGKFKASDIKKMAQDPIVFALANPDPEMLPDAAHKAGAAVVATGRSDFKNQVNNALVFPGVFRGALDGGIKDITDQKKVAAAEALARLIKRPSKDQILPELLDKRVVKAVAKAIQK